MNLQENIQSQYIASLDMFRQIVVKCPDTLWEDTCFRNVFWRVAYHALFYTQLYMQPQMRAFVAWSKHRPEYQRLLPGGEPYSKAEILEYEQVVREHVAQTVAAADLEAPSGFDWLPFNRLEAHVYNIRHLNQHIGELSERLGVTAEIEIDWIIKSK